MSTTAEARYARRLEQLEREYERMSSLLNEVTSRYNEVTSRYAELQASLEDELQQALARYYDKKGKLDAALEKKAAERRQILLEELKRRLR